MTPRAALGVDGSAGTLREQSQCCRIHQALGPLRSERLNINPCASKARNKDFAAKVKEYTRANKKIGMLAGYPHPAGGESGPDYGVDVSLPDSAKYSSLAGEWAATGEEGNQFAGLEYYKVREAIVDARWTYINADGCGASGTIPENTELTMTRGDFNGKKITVLSGSRSKTGWDAVNQCRAGTVTESIAGKFEVVDVLSSQTDGNGRSFTVQPGSKGEIKETSSITFAAKAGGGEGHGEETSHTDIREQGWSFIVADAKYTANIDSGSENVTRNGVLRQGEKENFDKSSGDKNAEEAWVSDKGGKVWFHRTHY